MTTRPRWEWGLALVLLAGAAGGLQAEGGEEAFRNIRIKPLARDK